MKNPKTKHKKAHSTTDDFQFPVDRIFSIMSVDVAKEFMKHLNNNNNDNDDQLKLEMQKLLETSDLILQRPNLTFKSLMNTDLFKQHQLKESMQLINQNPKALEPETSLWDSALIDYFLGCIKWSTSKWIEEFYKKKSNHIEHRMRVSMFQCLVNIDDSSEVDIEKLMCISISFSTAYALLRHLQLWQLANESLVKRQIDLSTKDEQIDKTCLTASIHFLKSMFQSLSTYTSREIDSHTEDIDQSNLVDFQKKFYGYLSILDITAGQLLIEYFSKHFLNKHNLLERVFGPFTACNQKLIKIPCPLHIETLLERYETTNSTWPAPLSEAVPLTFISKYPQLFADKVTKWLKFIEPIESRQGSVVKDTEEENEQPEEIQQQQQEEDEAENLAQISKANESLESEDSIFYEKYLTSIDSLDSDELNAIVQVSRSELDEIVKKLFNDVSLSDQQLLDKMKDRQIELGHRIIERAKLRITSEKNGQVN
ncbi:unnamed protein product [Trichobilharzia szidati]|nr:unnamed protein product [Trichobilharzia szidati]